MLVARLAPHSNQMPAAVELFAHELEIEMALGETLVRIADRRPGPAVPDQHRAAAVLALRDRPLERAVFERMVLDRDRKPLLAGDQARAARHRPALQDAVQFEPKIVVEAPRVVLLHDETVSAPGAADVGLGSGVAAKLRLARYCLERHCQPALLARARLRACGAFAAHLGAFAQRRHEVARGLTLRRLRRPDRPALELGFDEVGQRRLVAIVDARRDRRRPASS